jgi:hypothetical protein
LAALLIATGVGTLVYWVNYFLQGDVRVLTYRWYGAFEDSFPVADSWMAACAILAGIGLLRAAPWGALFGLLAGSALIFLAGMDITFNIENGLYALAAASDAMKFEIFLNVWTLTMGAVTIVACWRRSDG